MICTPPQMSGYVTAAWIVGAFAMVIAGIVAGGVMSEWHAGKFEQKVILGLTSAVVAFVIAAIGCAVIYQAANADYARCEQRIRTTVGAK